jgi:hypothetical protein
MIILNMNIEVCVSRIEFTSERDNHSFLGKQTNNAVI